jgi:hypothetical protein
MVPAATAQPASPRFTVATGPSLNPGWGIFGFDWTPGAVLTVTIDHAATAQSPDVTDTSMSVDQTGYFLNGFFSNDIRPGDVVTVTDGPHLLFLTILDPLLTVTEVDAVDNTVSGTAAPGSSLNVLAGTNWPEDGPAADAVTLSTTAAATTGVWTVSFGDQFDIKPGTGIAAMQGSPSADYWVIRKLSPQSKNDCKRSGWQHVVNDRGNNFRNQGDCVSSVPGGRKTT